MHSVGDVITPKCLPDSCRGASHAGAPLPDQEEFPDVAEVAEYVRRKLAAVHSDIYRTLTGMIDRIAMRETLRHVDNNQVQASERLGMSRTT